MRTVILAIKLLAIGYLARLLVFLLTGYAPAEPSFHPPMPLWMLDTINLFIHEAGHFFFKIFGQFIYILGGSLFQVMVPAALLIVVARQNIGHIWYPGFWMGENMVNVSVYIQDAPYRKLKLIAQGLIHDWYWLLNGDPDAAEILGGIIYWLGIVIICTSLGVGIFYAIKDFREDRVFVPEE
jgi:hypothetical protein